MAAACFARSRGASGEGRGDGDRTRLVFGQNDGQSGAMARITPQGQLYPPVIEGNCGREKCCMREGAVSGRQGDCRRHRRRRLWRRQALPPLGSAPPLRRKPLSSSFCHTHPSSSEVSGSAYCCKPKRAAQQLPALVSELHQVRSAASGKRQAHSRIQTGEPPQG